jgi:hypothetical protein
MNDHGAVFSSRETDVVNVSQSNHKYLRPERIRIQLDKKISAFPLDVGSFSYEMRARKDRTDYHKDTCTKVVLSSFSEQRRELVRCILECFSYQKSHSTILNIFRHYRTIFDWCDQNGHADAFVYADAVVPAYQLFTQHLNHRISFNELKPASASKLQEIFSQLAKIRFPASAQNIRRTAIPIIRKNPPSEVPPSENNFHAYFSTCLAVARQLSEFVLNNDNFPFVFQHRGIEVVHFPSTRGRITSLSNRLVPLYNQAERRISTIEEYLNLSPKSTRQTAAKGVRDSQLNLDSANSNPHHSSRLGLASLATRAYSCALLCIIGASPSEFIQFDFEEALDIERSPMKKEFSSVKLRAGGKKTRYAIGRKNGLTILREYIKLREWILDGKKFDKLFFVIDGTGPVKANDNPYELMVLFTSLYYRSVHSVYLDPNIPNITATSIRKYKSSILHLLGTSTTDVADVLNHTVSTNIKHYSEARIEQQQNEFGNFWQSVRRAAELVLERSRDRETNLLSTATGHCDDFNNPRPESSTAAPVIEPNCRAQYGCLYCENYICHADEIDMHKLLSLQYVINAVRNTAQDIIHAETLYKDLSIRIEFILEALSKRSEASTNLIKRIKYKVHELGELTVFWELRLQRYEKLGVVF